MWFDRCCDISEIYTSSRELSGVSKSRRKHLAWFLLTDRSRSSLITSVTDLQISSGHMWNFFHVHELVEMNVFGRRGPMLKTLSFT